ncbi:MAG: hypothetical protein FJ278_23795, partial [Planctomycetes bacterium]|nr:hypothetical protein [Planctomycetota bacterium]
MPTALQHLRQVRGHRESQGAQEKARRPPNLKLSIFNFQFSIGLKAEASAAPSSARPRRRWLSVLAAVLLLALLFAGYKAKVYTDSDRFCISCHEIKKSHETFLASKHNTKGIRCVSCHIA